MAEKRTHLDLVYDALKSHNYQSMIKLCARREIANMDLTKVKKEKEKEKRNVPIHPFIFFKAVFH